MREKEDFQHRLGNGIMRNLIIIVVAILAAGCDVQPKDDGGKNLKRPNNPVLDAPILHTGGKA
jgi:hypothetical protein